MSHIVSIKTKLTDAAALSAACRRLGLTEPVAGTATLFSTQLSGLLIHLPDWTYPAVVDTQSGEVKFDTYNGRWGDPAELHKLLQGYTVEKTRLEARKAGHRLSEKALADGSIQLTLHVGGAA